MNAWVASLTFGAKPHKADSPSAALTVCMAAGAWLTSWNSSQAGTPSVVWMLFPAKTTRAL
eukprot:16426945-Heterocapsa_arctica.AAC.1